FFQAEDGIRDDLVTGVQTCALPICENYRRAFDGFDAARIARYRPSRVRRLLANPGIVRNRLKIRAAIVNAKAFLAVQKEFGSFEIGRASCRERVESWEVDVMVVNDR